MALKKRFGRTRIIGSIRHRALLTELCKLLEQAYVLGGFDGASPNLVERELALGDAQRRFSELYLCHQIGRATGFGDALV